MLSKIAKMGSSNRLCSIYLAVPFVFALLLLNADLGSSGCFKRIFIFGDSITDAGNFAYTGRKNKPPGPPSVPPYGETYFHHPTGRASDGRLIVDFYAATKSLLSESLVVFGEIGGNDYNFWFFAGHGNDTHTPQKYMPDVIARIGDGVQEVINLGAKTVLVPGNFPIGCVPVYLSGNKSNKSADYDQFHCLKRFNKFSQMHNQLLKQEVDKLKSLNADAKIIYADYYGAFMEFVKNPRRNGIDDPLVACCGGDGPYGTGHGCNQTARVYPDPSRFASWDQIHMTEKAYGIIANGVLNGLYADTPLLHVC